MHWRFAFIVRQWLMNLQGMSMKTRIKTEETDHVDAAKDSELRSQSAALPKFVRLETLANELGISTSTVYSHIAQSLFPPPIKIGTASVWLRSEIDLYHSALIQAVPRSELRRLVKSWVAARYKQKNPSSIL